MAAKRSTRTAHEAPQGATALDRDVVVIGANTRVEIWDAGAWERYLGEKEQSFADLSEEVLPGLV